MESKRLLRDVLDTVPVRVFWKDLKGRFLGCNLPLARDAGFSSPNDIIGKDDSELPWSGLAEAYRADDLRIIETGIPKIGYEELLIRPNGGQIWLRTNKIPLTDHKGNILGVLGTYEDITDRKRADKEKEKMQGQILHAQKMESIGRLAGGVAP